MVKRIKTQELFECETEYITNLFKEKEYPWEILPHIKEYILRLIETGIEGFEKYSDDVLIGKNVKIAASAEILGPAIIGSGSEIRHGAFLRGSVITGENCVIGNSSEIKNSVLLNKVQIPHYNYVGDSILGNRAHMGAGSICSNLKSDGKNVVIKGDTLYETGIKKIGSFLADGADIGCGCVLNPGTVIGKNSSVYPLNSLRGVFPAECIIKSNKDIVKRN